GSQKSFSKLIQLILSKLDKTEMKENIIDMNIKEKYTYLTEKAFIDVEEIEDFAKTDVNSIVFYKETLKSILEVTRKLEDYEEEYHQVASKVIDFCLKHNLKDETKKLCLILRSHVNQILNDEGEATKRANSNYHIKIVTFSNVNTLKVNMQTWIKLFKSCLELNLWTEASMSLNKIHEMLNMKTVIQLNVAKIWYDFAIEIGEICLKCFVLDQDLQNGLHHHYAAFAFLKAFEIADKAKGPSKELLSDTAFKAFITTISLSPFSIPDSTLTRNTYEQLRELLEVLKSFKISRETLFSKAFSSSLLEYIPANFRKLGSLLAENDSIPEDLIKSFNECLPDIQLINNNKIITEKLRQSIFIYSLKVLSNIYSRVMLTEIQDYFPIEVKNKEELLNQMIIYSQVQGIHLRIEELNGDYELSFQVKKSSNTNSTGLDILTSTSHFYTIIYSHLQPIVREISPYNLTKIQENMKDAILNSYIESRPSKIVEIGIRMQLRESKLQKQEDKLKAAQIKKMEEEVEAQRLMDEKHKHNKKKIAEAKKDDNFQLVKDEVEKQELQKLKTVDKSLLSTKVGSLAEIQNIAISKEIQESINHINSCRQAEQLISHMSRLLKSSIKDDMVSVGENYTQEINLYCNNISKIKNENLQRMDQLIYEMLEKFSKPIEEGDECLDALEKHRDDTYNQQRKFYNAKCEELDQKYRNEERKKKAMEERQKITEELAMKKLQENNEKNATNTTNYSSSKNFSFDNARNRTLDEKIAEKSTNGQVGTNPKPEQTGGFKIKRRIYSAQR
ncbi:MAG: eukaryotic translation initiation factor 3 subunit A, partial [Paramarteilia canceri]